MLQDSTLSWPGLSWLVPASQRTVDGLSAKHLDERKRNHVDGRDKPVMTARGVNLLSRSRR